MKQSENPEFLQNQLITYIGNKRALLDFIGGGVQEVQARLGKSHISCLDVFAGSGIVSRYLKQFASAITVNDLEKYSCIINRCYLSNENQINLDELQKLQAKKVDYEKGGNESMTMKVQAEITKKTDFLVEYTNAKCFMCF